MTTLSGAASAQQPAAGFAVDRFDPAERGSEWFSGDSLDLRGNVRPALGLTLDYAYRPLVIYETAEPDTVYASTVRNQLFAHLGGSLVLWDRVRVGANLPIGIYEYGHPGWVTAGSPVWRYQPPGHDQAIGDLRLGADVRLLGTYGEAFTMAIGAQVFLPTGKQADYTGDENVRFMPRLQVAGDIGMVAYSAHAGVMVRPGDALAYRRMRYGSEGVFGATLGVRALDRKLVVGPEVYAATTLNDNAFEKEATPVEAMLGAHYTAGDFRFGVGGGVGLTRGYGSPASRLVASIEWAPGVAASDRDGDGIADNDDACPDQAGVKTSDPKTNGCPPPPADRDGDGVPDSEDACPDKPGVKTADPKTNGCPPPPADRDGDGVPDSEDACPDQAGVKTSDPKTNGCPPPPPDRDGDGIVDAEDACPDTKGVKTNDPKTNGCPPNPDRDGDGIVNEEDACPDAAGPKDPDPKKNGCPKAAVVGGQIKILEQVKFATGSAVILKESDAILEAVLAVLKEHPEIKSVRVEGHTDNQGPAGYNKILSKQRAASVELWLEKHGIDKNRVRSEGFGAERPIDDNKTEAGRHNNRRVEFHIEDSPK